MEIYEEEQVGYYFLSQCIVSEEYEKSVTDFFKNVIEQNINKVVLDLRDNGGGNSQVMYPFLQHLPAKFIREFEVQLKYSEEASNQNGYEQKSGKEAYAGRLHKNVIKEPTFNGDLYVLVNNGTFSAATDFATIIHDNSIGVVEGEPTGGAPSAFGDLILVDVPNSKLILAVSHKEFLRPNKSFLNDHTLHPNILIEKTKEDIHTHQDKYLQRVLKIINNN
ncbi:MAG: S41 family peptidase [Bacillaceae bacterium]|nr:S41 family peptidase [Bacillaceae bacterium]